MRTRQRHCPRLHAMNPNTETGDPSASAHAPSQSGKTTALQHMLSHLAPMLASPPHQPKPRALPMTSCEAIWNRRWHHFCISPSHAPCQPRKYTAFHHMSSNIAPILASIMHQQKPRTMPTMQIHCTRLHAMQPSPEASIISASAQATQPRTMPSKQRHCTSLRAMQPSPEGT